MTRVSEHKAEAAAEHTADIHTTAGKLADLRRREEETLHPVGEAAVEKVHAKGKLTARERIYALLDEGSFVELDALARHRSTMLARFAFWRSYRREMLWRACAGREGSAFRRRAWTVGCGRRVEGRAGTTSPSLGARLGGSDPTSLFLACESIWTTTPRVACWRTCSRRNELRRSANGR